MGTTCTNIHPVVKVVCPWTRKGESISKIVMDDFPYHAASNSTNMFGIGSVRVIPYSLAYPEDNQRKRRYESTNSQGIEPRQRVYLSAADVSTSRNDPPTKLPLDVSDWCSDSNVGPLCRTVRMIRDSAGT